MIIREIACKAGIAYLASPLFLFFGMWFRPIFGAILVGMLGYGLRGIFSIPDGSLAALRREKYTIAICAFFAAAFLLVSGGSPIIDSIGALDLQKHLSLERDLIRLPWPVSYFSVDDSTTILRYALGYYLVPAAIAKAIGISNAEWLVYVWSAIGLTMFLVIISTWARSFAWVVAFVIIALLWGGLDFVGAIATHNFSLNGLLNGWMYERHSWLIGSNVFSAAFSPQHAIAAWIAVSILFSSGNERWFRSISGLCVTIVAFWSPFVAIALAGIILGYFIVNLRTAGARDILSVKVLLPVVAVTIVMALYLGVDTSSIPFSFRPPSSISDYLLFISLEFLLIGIATAIALGKVSSILALSITLLMILPFVMGGIAGDLLMRGSIPLTTLLMLHALLAIQDGTGVARAVVLFLALGGCLGSALEIHRETSGPKTITSDGPIFMFQYPITPQYIASVPRRSILGNALKEPRPGYRLVSVPRLDASWKPKGNAVFQGDPPSVSSTRPTIASLDTPLVLSPGLYRATMQIDWHLEYVPQKFTDIQASIAGQRKIVGIDTWHWHHGAPSYSSATNRKIVTFFTVDHDKTPVLSFGLGGWGAIGLGTISLRSMDIQRLVPEPIILSKP